MSLRDVLRSEPWRFNFFRLFREYERANPTRPRIGRNLVTGDEYIRVEQDVFLEFPAANIVEFTEAADGKPDRIKARFLGYFGPQGPMPVNMTAEVMRWKLAGNFSFLHFTDIFATRFYQVLYRAWASARRIAQFDRPREDRFQGYVRALGGVPRSAAVAAPDSLPRLARLDVAGLIGGRVRSPRRLQQMIETVLQVEASVEEFMPLWIEFEAEDRSRLGAQGSTLGVDLRLGSRVQTVEDKIRINIRTRSLADYERFLPGHPAFLALTDLARGYLGPTIDIEIAPSMPAADLPSVRLGQAGAIGHTSWIAPKLPAEGEPTEYVQSAVFLCSAFQPDHEHAAGGRPVTSQEIIH